MRKFKNITVAALTFFAGVAIYFVFLNFAVDKSKLLVEPVKYSSLPLISLCEATNSYKFYEKKDIRVRVYLKGRDGRGYSALDFGKKCDFPDADIRFSLNEKSKNETDQFLKQFTEQHSENFIKIVGIEIIGELRDTNEFNRCYHRRFSIEAKEIRQISQIKQLSLSEWNEWNNKVIQSACGNY